MSSGAPRSAGFPPTLLGWLIARFSPFLFDAPASELGLVLESAPGGETFRVVSSTGRALGELRFRQDWPPGPPPFLTTGHLALGIRTQGEDARQVLTDLAHRVRARLIQAETRFSQPLGHLFPRHADGSVAWEQSPLEGAPGIRKVREPGYIKLGGVPCGLSCAFCTRSLEPPHTPPALYLLNQLYRAARVIGKAEPEGLLLSIGGDEPLKHPDIASLIALVARRGFTPRLFTSAVDLLTPERIRELLEKRLREIELPLYGISAAVHDAVVGKAGHFDDLVRAIGVLRRENVAVRVHSVPLTLNHAELARLPGFAESLGAVFTAFLYPRHEGESRLPVSELAPRLSSLPPAVRNRLNLRIPCLGIGCAGVIQDEADAAGDRELLGESSLETQDSLEHEFPEVCGLCKLRKTCGGLYRGYLERFGSDEFTPRR